MISYALCRLTHILLKHLLLMVMRILLRELPVNDDNGYANVEVFYSNQTMDTDISGTNPCANPD